VNGSIKDSGIGREQNNGSSASTPSPPRATGFPPPRNKYLKTKMFA